MHLTQRHSRTALTIPDHVILICDFYIFKPEPTDHAFKHDLTLHALNASTRKSSLPTEKQNSLTRNIIIIIMSCRQHEYPWPSLATSPYYSSPLEGLQGYILCPHRAAVCKFELVVLLLLGHMWGSIGVHHLWARPCFSGRGASGCVMVSKLN